MQFTKMHGLGNDYVVFGFSEIPDTDFGALAIRLCHRYFGVGADGLIAVLPSDSCNFRMRIFNSDGSEAEMCGNGVRCATKYYIEKMMPHDDRPAGDNELILDVETLAGVRTVVAEWRADGVGMMTVGMGAPILDPPSIPVNVAGDRAVEIPIKTSFGTFKATCVSMGNPHAVIFRDEDVDDSPVLTAGPEIEKHPMFPRKTNVEFVNVISETELKMRVWERGVGETLACGTGTCATAVAANITGRAGRKVTVHLRGGDLFIDWTETGEVLMSGPAEFVFNGTLVGPDLFMLSK
ncbi:MAG: diaminopimelate epimerase [bacterium]